MSLVHDALKRAVEDSPSQVNQNQPRRFHLSVGPSRAYRSFLLPFILLSVVGLTAIFVYQNKDEILKNPVSASSNSTDSGFSDNAVSPTENQGLQINPPSKGLEATAVIEEGVVVDQPKVNLSEGIHLYGIGKFVEAEREYQRNLLIDPENAVTLNNLGLTLKALQRFEEAESSYHKALEINPDLVEAINNLALLYEIRNRGEAAMRLYRRALEINPNYAAAHLNYASALERSGYPSEARRHFEAFLLNAPSENSREILLVKKHLTSSDGEYR